MACAGRYDPSPPTFLKTSGLLQPQSGRRPTVCWAGEGSCNVKIKQPTRCNRRESVAGEVFYCKIALSWTGNGRLDPDNVPLALSPLSTGSAGWSGKGGRRGCWGQKNRNQAFAKGIERGGGGQMPRGKGLRFGYFGDSRVQNGAPEGKRSFEAGPRGRGRASQPPPCPPLSVPILQLAGGCHQGRGGGV